LHNHFDKHLNLKELILERKPKVIVECGAGNGDLTRKIAGLLDVYPFEFHVISDHKVEGLDERINWIVGLSYEALRDFSDNSVDLCIIDTDHNYWTLREELRSLNDKITEGGLIALHDVETFYHDTGMACSYWNDKPYPRKEIEGMANQGSLGDAMLMFLISDTLHWKILAYDRHSHGAAVLERKTQSEFSIIVPGPGAGFAPKQQEELHASLKAS
jgi:hypothetical protein